jgi:1-phosphatidylinositol-3-phosphate 5-kinase
MSLREDIGSCSNGGINGVRCKIKAAYDSLHLRILALSKTETADIAKAAEQDLPEYFGRHVHSLPGSSVLIREDEPSSIIAYTIS